MGSDSWAIDSEPIRARGIIVTYWGRKYAQIFFRGEQFFQEQIFEHILKDKERLLGILSDRVQLEIFHGL